MAVQTDERQPTRDSGRPSIDVPPMLAGAAAWCWRILVVALAFLALVTFVSKIALITVPLFVALLFAALLHPVVAFLRRRGWPRALATWGTLILAFLLICAVAFFVVERTSSNYQQIINDVSGLTSNLRARLNSVPGANSVQLQDLQTRLTNTLKSHTQVIAGGVLSAGQFLGEAITGAIIAFFVTFFFLEDGDRIWSWTVRLFPDRVQPSMRGAGYRAWHVLSGWITGTAIIAVFHGVVIGFVLYLLGVPLVLPLAVLIFLGSFIPIVGAVLFGGLAVLVALLTQGLVPAVILLGVLVIDNQIEAHLLQPFIVGRAVHLHPVAIVLVLAGAGVLGGLIGAIFAIPLVASVHAAVKYLTGIEDVNGNSLGDDDRRAPEPPPTVAPLPLYADRVNGHRGGDDDGQVTVGAATPRGAHSSS